jgi:hypothetical protein
MGLLSGAHDVIRRRGSDAASITSGGAPSSPDKGQAPDGRPDDTEVLDKEEGSILSAMISQREFSLHSLEIGQETRCWELTDESLVTNTDSKNRNGPFEDHFPYICIGTSISAGTYHGFHGPPRAHVQVSYPFSLCQSRISFNDELISNPPLQRP